MSDRIVPHPDGEPQPRVVLWRGPDDEHAVDCDPFDLAEQYARGDGALWVHIDSTSTAQHALLASLFNFHPLAIEDTLNPASRVKIEEYPGHLFLSMRSVAFETTTEDPYDVRTQDLYAFFGTHFLVTVQAGPAPSIEAVAARLRRSPELLARGVEHTLHAVLDETVDSFFPLLRQIDEFVDGLEERVFVEFDDTALRDIFAVKRLVLSLRRYLAPMREVLAVLTNRPTPLLTPAVQLYFRDIYDHVLRINDSLDTYRELLGSTMDSYLTQVSNRLGATTKALSVLATMSLPFVVISGMWGMNFDHIPLSGRPFGFLGMVVLQLGIGLGLLWLLRKRRIL